MAAGAPSGPAGPAAGAAPVVAAPIAGGGGATVATSTSPSSSPLIVTSTGSRNTTATNLSTVGAATNNLAGPTFPATPLTNGGMTATPGFTTTPADVAAAKAAGWTAPGTSAPAAPAGGTAAPAGGAAAPAGSTAAPAGGATGPVITDASGNPIDTSNMDPSIVSSYQDTLTQLDNQVAQAQASLQGAAATLANDPAGLAQVNAVAAEWQQQINLVKTKNATMLGRASSAIAAYGGLGQMSNDFLGVAQQNALNNLSDATNKAVNAIAAATSSFQKGDLAAFNAATKDLNDAQDAKTKALTDLTTAAHQATVDARTAATAAATAQRQQQASDISLSTALSDTVASTIASEGLTGDAAQAYIDGVAKAQGITDPTILESAVTKAQTTAATAASTASSKALSDENIQSEINTRATTAATKGNKTDGSYTYTPADISTYSSLLNKGGTGPDGTKYAARDSNGYVDPAAYTAAYSDWVSQGGTPKGFLAEFPATDVNPDDYADIPAALVPKAAAAPLPAA